MIYALTKFEVATSNGLGEDTITRNVTADGQTDGRTDGRTTDRLWYEINIKKRYEKAGIISMQFFYQSRPILCYSSGMNTFSKRTELVEIMFGDALSPFCIPVDWQL